MTAASQVPRQVLPERIVVLSPNAFASDYHARPSVNVAIGIRRLSQGDLDVARREAEREAVGFYEEVRGRSRPVNFEVVDEVRNDALMVIAVGRAATDPNNVEKTYFLGQEDEARSALTPEGIRRIWDELVLLHAGGNVARPRASDKDMARLGRALAKGRLKLDDEARMLGAHLLELLEVPDEIDEVEEDAVYVVRSA